MDSEMKKIDNLLLNAYNSPIESRNFAYFYLFVALVKAVVRIANAIYAVHSEGRD